MTGVAVCHEWVTTYGGSEQVAARLATALDAREVFTFAADRQLAARVFPDRPVTVIGRFGETQFGRRRWAWLLPLMPRAWKRLRLDEFEVVVTSSHSCVNAVRAGHARHISYCHTPMRYAWEWRSEIRRIPMPLRFVWPAIASIFRARDKHWAQGVDIFIANSRYVAERIRRSYGRDAQVIYPPIDTHFWTPGESASPSSFFLCVGRLVAYKRFDICVEAAARAHLPLVIAGDGPEIRRLRGLAQGHDIRFVISPTDEDLRDLYRRARALIFAGVEDFGMTLIESQACGTPVIAFDRGGAAEAVVNQKTGILYKNRTPDALAIEMTMFDRGAFALGDLRRQAEMFSVERFDQAIRDVALS